MERAGRGVDAEQVVDSLLTYSRYAVPNALLVDVAETMSRYGRLQLSKHEEHGLVLTRPRPAGAGGGAPLEEGRSRWSAPASAPDAVVVHPSERGTIKQVLLKLGWPAEDLAGYVDGEAHAIDLDLDDADGGAAWDLRPYQAEAVDGFWHGGSGRRRPALRRGQDPGRRGRDGPGARRPR